MELNDPLLPMGNWKKINAEGCESYLINEKGEVWSCKSRKIIADEVTSKGFKAIKLRLAPKVRKFLQIHRLLAEAFLPNPNNYFYVHHINGDKLDNSLLNLEWSDQKERDPRKGEDHGRAKLTEDEVREIRNLYGQGPTLHDLATQFNVSYSTVRDIVMRSIWRHI